MSIADGATLDLSNNKLVVTGESIATIEALIASGHNRGTWDGDGIVTSQADAVTGLTSLGVSTAASTGHADFGGVGVAGDDVLVMYTYRGDANLDGFISADDYTAIDFAVGTAGASGWSNGDFNYDGFISADDYTAIDFNLVAQGAPFVTTGGAALASVPEPAVTSVLVVVAAFTRRRGRTASSI